MIRLFLLITALITGVASAAPPDSAASYDALMAQGARELERGVYTRALEAYEAALRRRPRDFDARLGRARALIGVGRAREGEQALEVLSWERPMDPRLKEAPPSRETDRSIGISPWAGIFYHQLLDHPSLTGGLTTRGRLDLRVSGLGALRLNGGITNWSREEESTQMISTGFIALRARALGLYAGLAHDGQAREGAHVIGLTGGGPYSDFEASWGDFASGTVARGQFRAKLRLDVLTVYALGGLQHARDDAHFMWGGGLRLRDLPLRRMTMGIEARVGRQDHPVNAPLGEIYTRPEPVNMISRVDLSYSINMIDLGLSHEMKSLDVPEGEAAENILGVHLGVRLGGRG